ncbi:MAG: protein kinase, partial [Actinobacteria bacterium]|nr:protein kinase [Actinomycetota bacterium]
MASQEEREHLSRAAEREFALLDAVSHPGIIRVQNWYDHELGPALVFERDPSEIRLDHYLTERSDVLGIEQRLELVRQLAEAVAYAHSRRLFHRALSPRSILVIRPDTPQQRFSILNWQAGLRDSGDTLSSTVSGTSDVDQLLDEDASAYLAPEALQGGADPELLDVFSLGAIAFHVFTGQPAAGSYAALVSTLERDGCLEVASALDGAGPNLVELIRQTTAADARTRLSSVSDVLELLDYLEDEITAPDEPANPEPEIKLADVGRGSQLAGFEVDRRLGRGSTAIAFLVTDADDSRKVLKVAADPDRNDRIRDEGEVLAKLDDPTIVSIHGAPVDVNGHAAIVLTYASEGTLASRLQREGRLGLETLERWGADLLGAVSYLERVGIAHRDIKPENLGIIEHPGNRRRHLVLMDFSLSRAPTDQIRAGTPDYIDPFLGTQERPRWDLAAERYAAAVVLHEMATGSPPRWPANARVIEDEVTLNRDALPREVAAPLGDLLARALRRDAGQRFDTAEEMLAAWRRIFEQLDSKPVTIDERDQDPASLRAAATLETPLVAIGLSARATNALERINVQLLTVEDFIGYPIFRLNRLPGVGMDTRDELREAYHDLRNRLGTQERPKDLTREGERHSLAELVDALVPAPTTRNETEVKALRLLLGLAPLAQRVGPWLSQTDVATTLDVTRARVGQVLATARKRWSKQPALNELRDVLLTQLQQLGGVAAAEELERAVAGRRGQGEERVHSLARAAVRAAIETELAAPTARVQQRRAGARVLLADVRDQEIDGAAALAWAVRLGERADELGGLAT